PESDAEHRSAWAMSDRRSRCQRCRGPQSPCDRLLDRVSNTRRIIRNMIRTVDAAEPPRQPPSPQTGRVVAIMQLLGSQPTRAFSLAEISRELRISRATGHAILTTLAAHRWVVRDIATAAYFWGPGIASLAKPASDRIFHGILQEL